MVQSSRVLRLLALGVVLAVAYFAQYLFDHGTLQNLYPAWMLERLPFLQGTTYWENSVIASQPGWRTDPTSSERAR